MKIQKLENKILGQSDYGTHCYAAAQTNSSCNDLAYQSPLRVFDKMNITKELKDMSQREIDNVIKRAWRNKDVRKDIETSFDKNVTLNNLTASYLRTIFTMGGPLDIDGYRYQNKSENETEQNEYTKTFVLKVKDIVSKTAGNDPQAFGAYIRFASTILKDDIF